MSPRRTWPVVVTIIFVILLAIALGTVYYLIFPKAPTIAKETVVEVTLQGILGEFPPRNPFAKFLLGDSLSLWELRQVFEAAVQDHRVSGICLEIHLLALSWAQVEELRDLIQEFRQSGKPIHAFLAVDMIREIELYLASAADSITVNPDAGLLVNGLLAEVTFFKETMDKLGIRPQFIQFKEYKSAETYTRKDMSPDIREMYESILGDLEQRFVSTVARDRQVEERTLRDIMETGVMPVTEALSAGLVDALGHRDDVERKLLVSEEGADEYRGMHATRYLNSVKDKYRPRSQQRVALVGGLGLITSGHSDSFWEVLGGTTMSSNLRRIRRDKRIKGVILRVDSPGGSAVGSDMVWKEIKLLGESGKPVVVSMSGVAGSGGYYISMAAQNIVSQPSTITGSIGVIFGKFDMKGFYRWLGMTVDRVKLSPNADILSPVTSLNSNQRKSVESWMKEIYETFVQKAAEGRGLDNTELELKARGRIYTGAQAKEIGLIDQLGGMRVAISQMKKALGLTEDEEIELVLYPRSKSLWESLTSGEFLGVWQRFSLSGWLKEALQSLSTPAPWLLMPAISIQ